MKKKFFYITQGSSVEEIVKEFVFSRPFEFLDRLHDSFIKNAPLSRLKKEKLSEFLKLHRGRESVKECGRLHIVECGDETPTAMRDTIHLCKVSGWFIRLELKAGSYSL